MHKSRKDIPYFMRNIYDDKNHYYYPNYIRTNCIKKCVYKKKHAKTKLCTSKRYNKVMSIIVCTIY